MFTPAAHRARHGGAAEGAGRKPAALVSRYDLIMSLEEDYGRALYAKKPLSVRMDARPLLVDSETAIDELEWMRIR